VLYPETQRQATQHDCLPDCWAMGTNKVKKCAVRKIIFCMGRLEQPRQDKNLLYRYDESSEPTKDPFHLYSVSPHSPQFQQSARAPLSSLSGCAPCLNGSSTGCVPSLHGCDACCAPPICKVKLPICMAGLPVVPPLICSVADSGSGTFFILGCGIQKGKN
jgi:hypothetical protein